MAPGTSSMLRARRRDVNVKPNRVLDRNSSRGMIYENEELRLRTININAEVEKGHSDIKKLRLENDRLRREIWNLRDEYDRLEALYKAKQLSMDTEEEELESEDQEAEGQGEPQPEDRDETAEDNMANQRKDGDVLSVVEEEPEDLSDNGEDHRQRIVSFKDDNLTVPGKSQKSEDVETLPCWPDDSYIPGPQIPVPPNPFPGLETLLRNVTAEQQDQVLTPGGSEVVTTAILQRRQSYTHSGDPTKDTFTCATSQHTTTTSGSYPCADFPATDPPQWTSQCEAYNGPAPSFLRLNCVQPFTLVFPVVDSQLSNLSVQEVIDALSDQLNAQLMHSLRGVRLVGGSCYLSFSAQQDADTVLSTPLSLRGVPISLEDASAGTTILSLSGVPHDVTDDAVASVLSHFGSLVGPVERRVYKGVDTGERLVRIRARLTIPRWIWLDGCRVCLKVLRNEEISNLSLARRKSFRSHISVQLKPVSEDTPPIPPLPTSAQATLSPRVSLANTNPFTCGSVPSIPVVPNTTESQVSYMSNVSASTPNIFQESPFLFPSPFQTTEPPGLRRINSVMGTMSLGGSPDITRCASSPPTARIATSEGEALGPNSVPPSPNTARRAIRKPSRKISKMSAESRKANCETSSSDQDSPHKLGRRRPSSVYFKHKSGGILSRTTSDHDGTGYDATSERERSNSDLSSRISICRRKMSTTGRESGKVPWCGCWGNGCI
uniref:Uncharacterized protein n=1 Tax=Homalodisca liturata TaxID=320908 RepID=A0A1B6K698_9HEMI